MSELQDAINREASGDLTGPVDGPIASRLRDRRESIAEETALSRIDVAFSVDGGEIQPRVTDAAAANVREYLDSDEVALIQETLRLPSTADAAGDVLAETPVRIAGDVDADAAAALADVDPTSDRSFISRVGDRVSLTLYGEDRDAPAEGVPTLEFADQDRLSRFVSALRAADAETVADALDDSTVDEGLVTRADDRMARHDRRETARDAAEAAGVDLDEFGIDARADGEVIVQNRDTGETRTIGPDAPGGVGSAIDAATADGQFVADDADPAASGSGSGDGLGARAAGAIVLLFGAIAAGLGWLS